MIETNEQKIKNLKIELAKLEGKKEEKDMTTEEWVQFKISQWCVGSQFCQDQEKGRVIEYLFNKLQEEKR